MQLVGMQLVTELAMADPVNVLRVFLKRARFPATKDRSVIQGGHLPERPGREFEWVGRRPAIDQHDEACALDIPSFDQVPVAVEVSLESLLVSAKQPTAGVVLPEGARVFVNTLLREAHSEESFDARWEEAVEDPHTRAFLLVTHEVQHYLYSHSRNSLCTSNTRDG
jgi:hypothetical protein